MPKTHLTYVTHKVKRSKNQNRPQEAKGSRDPKFRSGEQTLTNKQNVTHNNIITANNVIINYTGDKPKGTEAVGEKQPAIDHGETAHFNMTADSVLTPEATSDGAQI